MAKKIEIAITARVMSALVEMAKGNADSKERRAIYFDKTQGISYVLHKNSVLVSYPWDDKYEIFKGREEQSISITLPDGSPNLKLLQQKYGSYVISFTDKKDKNDQVDIEVAYYTTASDGQMKIGQFATTFKYKGHITVGNTLLGVIQPFKGDMVVPADILKKVIKAGELVSNDKKTLAIDIYEAGGLIKFDFRDRQFLAKDLEVIYGIVPKPAKKEEEPKDEIPENQMVLDEYLTNPDQKVIDIETDEENDKEVA